MNKILIISNNKAIRESLKHLLSCLESVQIDAQSSDMLTHPSFLLTVYKLLIIDLSLGKPGTLMTLKKLRAKFPDLPILAMGEYTEPEFSGAIVKAGASKYISINTTAEEIHRAVVEVGPLTVGQN